MVSTGETIMTFCRKNKFLKPLLTTTTDHHIPLSTASGIDFINFTKQDKTSPVISRFAGFRKAGNELLGDKCWESWGGETGCESVSCGLDCWRWRWKKESVYRLIFRFDLPLMSRFGVEAVFRSHSLGWEIWALWRQTRCDNRASHLGRVRDVSHSIVGNTMSLPQLSWSIHIRALDWTWTFRGTLKEYSNNVYRNREHVSY